MKILHISKYYFPFMGGVENICMYLVEHMNHITSVVCFNETRDDGMDVVNGHNVYRSGSLFSIARQSVSLSYGKILKKAIKTETPDVIQFHWANPFPAIFLRFLLPKNCKLVLHWHMDIIRQWYLYWAVRPLERWLVKRADRIVVTSPNYRDGSKPLQKSKDKVRIVPNCIEEDKLKLQAGDSEIIESIRKQYNYKPIVFFVGRHTKYKGLPHLILAEKYISTDCVVVVAGTGPLSNALKRAALGRDRICFVGRLSEKELRCYLYAASVFAFPSITKNEAFGVALAEAMYCNTPAVTFTIPGSGVNWVSLDKITGFEIKQGVEMDQKFAHAIDMLLSDDTLREHMGFAAHERVSNHFLMHHMVEAMEGVYKELR